jgi:hypothetical protein
VVEDAASDASSDAHLVSNWCTNGDSTFRAEAA